MRRAKRKPRLAPPLTGEGGLTVSCHAGKVAARLPCWGAHPQTFKLEGQGAPQRGGCCGARPGLPSGQRRAGAAGFPRAGEPPLEHSCASHFWAPVPARSSGDGPSALRVALLVGEDHLGGRSSTLRLPRWAKPTITPYRVTTVSLNFLSRYRCRAPQEAQLDRIRPLGPSRRRGAVAGSRYRCWRPYCPASWRRLDPQAKSSLP